MGKDLQRTLQDGSLEEWMKRERRRMNENNTLVALPTDALLVICLLLPLTSLCSLTCVYLLTFIKTNQFYGWSTC